MTMTHLIGQHRLRFDDHIIHIDYSGDYSGQEAAEITRMCAKHIESYSRTYALCNIANVGRISSDARQAWIDLFRKHTVEAIVCYGAGNFTTRTVLKMFAAASRVLLRLEPHFVFVSTEAEGRDWIRKHHARIH